MNKPSFEASMIWYVGDRGGAILLVLFDDWVAVIAHLIFDHSSSLAGGLASFLTSPLDLAKLRLQVDRSKQRAVGLGAFHQSEYVTYKSFYDVLKKTFLGEGGVRGLYRGAFARVSLMLGFVCCFHEELGALMHFTVYMLAEFIQ